MASTVIPLRQSAVESSLKQAAFDHLALAALCINASGQILAINAAALAMAGLNADAVVGRHLSEFLSQRSARDSARRWARLWARLQREPRVTMRTRLALLDGRQLVVALEAETLRFESDTVAVIVLRDLALQRAGERAARLRRARAHALAHAPGAVAIMMGADRRVTDVDADPSLWPELRAADVLGVPFDLLLEETAGAELRALVEQFAAPDGPNLADRTWRLRARADGTRARWLRARLANRLHDDMLKAIVIVGEDDSERVALHARTVTLERHLIALSDRVADLLMLLDESGVVRFQSPAIHRTLRIAPESTLGRHGATLAVAADRPLLTEAIRAAAHRGALDAGVTHRISFAGADGAGREFSVTLRNCIADPALGGILLTGSAVAQAPVDVAPLSREARQLEFRERLLELAMQTRSDFAQSLSRALRMCALALDASKASFWRAHHDPEELRCEAHFDAIKDRFSRESIGASLSPDLHPEYFARLRQRQPLVAADLEADEAFRALSGDGRLGGVRATLDVPVLLDGEVEGVLRVQQTQPRVWDEDEVSFVTMAALLIALAMEAAQRQEAESRIEQLAWYDSLTGLPNRNLLRENMRDMIMTAVNRERRIAVMLIDLDRFKDVNDTLGHLVGDALIRSAAQLLKKTVGDAGMVARLGGDEFVVLLEEFQHRQEVALLAARIAQALHRTDLVPNVDTQVSASIGVALFPEHGREISTLLKNADAAMYQAKRDGRNQFSFFNPIRAERAAREVQLGIQLLKALQGDAPQFVVYYQPVVEMTGGRVVGLEALIRWQHPTYGLLTPDRFIGVAELSGLSERITRWVVNRVCAQIVAWREKRPGFDIPVSINVAGRETGSSVLPLIVRNALGKYGIEARMITLEITERTLVRENEVNNDVLAELASLGVGLVLDDFGTGYSMLGYLKRMPISALKIDQSFVRGVPQDADSCAIVHAMLAVARHFRLKVIAEGVETEEQVNYIRSIGCDFAQGFHYSRPMDPDSIVGHIDLSDSAATH
ncbi:MAG TPA: EAL domain-containing protein [Burkholderiaceae bacterium]|nr:EAL domain-containing protein [Burkholderiaceae bacterium]